MFTSDINRSLAKISFFYLLIALFCALFGAVYEVFSHQVFSFYMLYAFAYPLGLGTLPYLLLSLQKEPKVPSLPARTLGHWAVAAFTLGSIVKGVLEIFGTTHRLSFLFWVTGGICLLASLFLFFRRKRV